MTRTISTRVAITGEDEYRASLSRMNAELKALQGELRLSEAEFRNNANSVEALTAKDTALNNIKVVQEAKVKKLEEALENARKAEEKWAASKEELNDRLKENEKALKSLGERTEENAEEFDRLTAEHAELDAALKTSSRSLESASSGVLKYEAKLTGAKIALAKTNADLELNSKYLKEAKSSTDGCATSIDQFGKRLSSAAEKSDQLYDALASAGLIAALRETAQQLKACIDASIEFESAMAGVKKTTDMSVEELGEMADAIQEMATRMPATTTEIAGVVEAAGQLGIAKEDLLDFTEVMINLGVATNLTSEEAATSLAKMANITGTPAEDFERLGSTIVDLGNNFATTEAAIVAMATRLAAAGTLAGLNESQILALSTAMSSVGIEAEAGGTAMTQTLTAIETAVVNGGKKLEGFAKVAGMSATDFATAWNTSPIEAVYAFMAGVGALESKGESAALVLDDLGLSGIRQSNMIKALGNASEVLAGAIGTANVAWEENNALAVEANTRYATTESKMQMLSNAANNLKIAVGDELTPALGKFADGGTMALAWMTDFIDDHEMLVPVLTAAAATMGVLTTAVVGYTVAAKAASAISKMLTTAMTANPYLIAATAVAALVAGIGTLVVATADEVESVKELSDAALDAEKTLGDVAQATETSKTTTDAAAAVASDYIDRLKQLEAAGLTTTEQQKEYHNILVLLTQTIPDLARYIDIETDSIWGGTDALDANTEAWRQNAIAQAYQEQLTEISAKYADVLIEQAENEIKLTQAQEQRRAKTEEQNAVADRMNQLMAKASEEAARQYEEYGSLVSASDLLTQEYYDLEEQYRALGDEIEGFETQENKLTKAIDNDREAVAAAEEEMSSTQAAIAELTGETEDNTEAVEANAAAQEDAASSTSLLQTKAQALAEAYKAAREEVSISIGLFGEFKAELDDELNSVGEMTERWNEQAEAVNAYTENVKLALAYAQEYGLSEDLIAEFTDGSAESAAQLDVIISKIQAVAEAGGDAQAVVDSLNAAYGGAQQAQSDFADTVAYWESGFADAIAEMALLAEGADYSEVKTAVETAFSELDIDLAPAWETFMAAMSAGVEASAETTKEDLSVFAEDAVAGLAEKWDEEGLAAGAAFAEAVAKGVEDEEEAVEESAEAVGETLTETMESDALEAVEAFVAEFEKITEETTAVLETLRGSIALETEGIVTDFTTTGREMINGMIAGLNERASSLYTRIAEIVDAAIQTANATADVHSPSGRTEYTFEMVGEGMIAGVEKKREAIKATMQDVVDDSLRFEVSGQAAIEATLAGVSERLPSIRDSGAASLLEGLGALFGKSKGSVITNVYPQSMDAAQIDYLVKRIIREIGESI